MMDKILKKELSGVMEKYSRKSKSGIPPEALTNFVEQNVEHFETAISQQRLQWQQGPALAGNGQPIKQNNRPAQRTQAKQPNQHTNQQGSAQKTTANRSRSRSTAATANTEA